MPKTRVKPDETRKSSIPYARPWRIWITMVDQIESIDKFLSSKTFLRKSWKFTTFQPSLSNIFIIAPTQKSTLKAAGEKGRPKKGISRKGRFAGGDDG
jgi:hypothetical protein